MRRRNSLIFIFCLFFLCCQKKEESLCAEGLQEATIIGQDFRRCVCCSGWFIDLGQDTVRTLALPVDFMLEADKDLPLEICLAYGPETGSCKDFEKLIIVEQISRR